MVSQLFNDSNEENNFKILETYNLDFSGISSHLKCIICKNILINAKQTSCGCRACHKCIQIILANGIKFCPNNEGDCANTLLNIDKNIYQDNAINKEIANLIVKCPFKRCQFNINLKFLKKHLDECRYREIFCDQCDKKITFDDKYHHDQLLCLMRTIICSFCFKKMLFNDYNKEHFDIESDKLCNNYIDICPNNCNLTETVNLKQHLKSCSNKKQNCPFSNFDCVEDKMTKDDLMKHLNHKTIEHTSSVMLSIKKIEETIENINNKVNIQQSLINDLKEIIKKNQEFEINVERIVEDLPNNIPNIKMDSTYRSGNFIWKFTNFDVHRIEAVQGDQISFTSEPFYTSEFGYKLCLRIYPAGNGNGKGTHLSMFFAIMKGDFDDLLTWPFRQKVTLSILDQEFRMKHYSVTFNRNPKIICYQKPTSVCNVATGLQKFIALSMINNNSSYYRNNTIYFKISVDTN